MTALACQSPIEWPVLLAYWLGELDAENESRTEEHVLGCTTCSERLAELVALANGTKALVASGAVNAIVTDAFARGLTARGVRVREYRVQQDGSVNCTVAPEDEVVLARLEAPLGGIKRLDLVEIDPAGSGEVRHEDIPFSTAGDGVVMAQNIGWLRSLPASTVRVRLLAVDESGERVVGDYTFNHAPFGTRR